MAARKSKAPPAGVESDDGVPDVGADAGAGPTADSETTTEAATEDGTKVPTDEERIQTNAKRQLETSTDNLATRLKQAESKVSALTGELKKAEAKSAALEKQVTDLTIAVAAANTAARNSGALIAGLPENARQLNECVTIASITPGRGKGGRHQAKAGDVLLLTTKEKDVDALQEKLGISATVYMVDDDTVKDLDLSGFLHK